MEATTDTATPITADVESSLLDTNYLTLYARGLTFKDLETGELATRGKMDICRMSTGDGLTAEDTVEIPAKNSEKPYTAVHQFKPLVSIELCDNMAESFEKTLKLADAEEEAAGIKTTEQRERSGLTPGLELQQSFSQAGGFVVGHNYEIGLGEGLSHVSWWKNASKREIFAWRGSISREGCVDGKLQMRVQNSVCFEVVP